MRENIISLRVRNAKLERVLKSKPARRAIRRIRTELARRGTTTAQREGILHDSLLMLAECEAAGGSPVEMLLGTTDVSKYDDAIAAFCDELLAECPRLPTALVVTRFFALLFVAFAVVLAAHLAYRVGSRTPGGWLPRYEVNLRYVDLHMFEFELIAVPLIFLAAQVVASLMRRNPWPHAFPLFAAPSLFGLLVGALTTVGPVELPGGFVLYNPLFPDLLLPILEDWLVEGFPQTGPIFQGLETIDFPWFRMNIFLGFAVILGMVLVGLAVVYLIERRNPRA